MDFSILHTLNQFLVHRDGVEDPLTVYVNLSEYLFVGMLVVVLLFARGAQGRPWRRAAVAAGLSAALALAIGQVVAHLVDRARPFVSHPSVHLFTSHAADASFPSDHATGAFAVGVAIMLRSRVWGTVVLVLAVILSVGRVMVGLHYPSDVLGGAVLGSLAALLLWWRPIRDRVDSLSDTAGGLWDRAVDRLLAQAGSSART